MGFTWGEEKYNKMWRGFLCLDLLYTNIENEDMTSKRDHYIDFKKSKPTCSLVINPF